MAKVGEHRWEALDGNWLYLGRTAPGAFSIAALPGPEGLRVPLFSRSMRAKEFHAGAPEGLELLSVAADDLRAKEEWLRAALEQGAGTVLIDPDPVSLEPLARVETHEALWYVLSYRQDSACI